MPTLRDLLAAPKRAVSHRPGKTKAKVAHEQYDVNLEVPGVEGRFWVFVRVSIDLPESFSVGLAYEMDGMAARQLLRVNGDHGGDHRNPDGSVVSDVPHVHRHPEDRATWEVSSLSIHAKEAARLVQAPLTLPQAWDVLCKEGNIRDDANVRNLMWNLHAKVAQTTLDLP